MKKKRALYNLIVGMGSKFVLMVLGFIIPKIFIENYGSDVNGLLSSIGQVFAYLNLVEAGIGVATTQALYKAVAKDDWNEISAIMNASSGFYRRTGTIYFIGVVITSLFYAVFVKTPLFPSQVFLLILFSGMGNVLNYFFQSKYIALLNTEGKTYIHVGINTVIQIFTQILKIIMISNRFDIVLIYFVYLMITAMQILALNIYMHRNYRNKLNHAVKPNRQALNQHSSVLIHQISGVVFSNTDVLILTAFTNLQYVSIYTIYNMVITNLNVLTITVLDSFTSALGLIYNESKERFNKVYDLYELGSWIVCFILMSVTLLLYKPFITLYTANADINYVDTILPMLFVLNQLLSFIRMPGLKVMNIEGCFKDTRSRTIIETVINLFVSLIAVQFIGIYGVLLGTTVALSYRTVDIIIYSNRKILKRKWTMILRRLLVNVAMFVILFFLLRQWIVNINSVAEFLVMGIKTTFVATGVYLLANLLSEIGNENVKGLINRILPAKEKGDI